MPGFNKFLTGMGLNQNHRFGGFILANVQGQEQTVQAYHHYQYPIELTFQPISYRANPEQLIHILSTEPARIIHTSYGNPYSCHLENVQIVGTTGNSVTIEALGHCTRIYQ